MKRLPILLSSLIMGATASWADMGQTVTIDGTVVAKFANGLTFDGDNVILTFEDGTSQTADMSLVSIDLTYDASAITEVTTGSEAATRVYTISGQYVGTTTEGLPGGLYIVGGKKTIIH